VTIFSDFYRLIRDAVRDVPDSTIRALIAEAMTAIPRTAGDHERSFWMIRLDAMTEVAVDRGLGGPPWTPPPTSTTTRRATP
jgi:hypothetical protein